MKVFEILHGVIPQLSEEDIIKRLQNFDWKYEYSDDLSHIARSNKQLELLENLIYKMWKSNPDRAVFIWNTNTPLATEDVTVVPSFIYRLASQDSDVVLPSQIN